MRTLVVTGASRGFGYHVARCALAAGLKVIPVARSNAGLSDLNSEWPQSCFPVEGDVSDPQTKAKLDAAIRTSGSVVDILLNNAGTPGTGRTLSSVTPDILYGEFAVHCVGPLLCTQSCLPFLRPGSAIVNVTSRLGSMGRTSTGEFAHMQISYSYRIAKAAQNMLSLCLAQESALSGVIVCGLHPGRLKSGCGRPDAPTEPVDAAQRFMHWSNSISNEMHGHCYDLDTGEIPW